MQEEFSFATFNVLNLAPAGVQLYDNLAPATAEETEAKLNWIARQLDLLDADVIGFQEIFSQAMLQQVLARTERYRDARHVGFDPDPTLTRYTPSVALVSRLPLAESGHVVTALPEGVSLPPGSGQPDRFARPVLQVAVQVAPGCIVDVLVVHLKSKRPDYRNGDDCADPLAMALASLRSLVWRGTEAAGLRLMLGELARARRRPRIVLGDFNDVAEADTTGLVMGAGAPFADRLYDAYQVQSRTDPLRHVGYSHLHEGHYVTIDHILVSEEFRRDSALALGEVQEVRYLNDHLGQDLPGASDHGQVLARLRLFGADELAARAGAETLALNAAV